MYSPGEIIVHPLHGAGRIEEIVEQKVAGEIRKYYVLQIPTDHVRVMVPVDGCEHIGIRPAVTAEEARDILAAFAKNRGRTRTELEPALPGKHAAAEKRKARRGFACGKKPDGARRGA